MKTLIFEGAGWDKASSSINSGVGNCRIRTRIRNNEGRLIYLEMGGFETSKNSPKALQNISIPCHINHLFYDDSKWDSNRGHSIELTPLLRESFEYNNHNILNFVNEKLDCSFSGIKVINEGLRVHDTTEPLCDCSKKGYIPFKEIEVNISELDGIKPISDYRDRGYARYKINYEFIKKLPFISEWINNRTEREQQSFPSYNYYFSIYWNKEGIINSLELSSRQNFCTMGFGAEVLKQVIKDIKESNNMERMCLVC